MGNDTYIVKFSFPIGVRFESRIQSLTPYSVDIKGRSSHPEVFVGKGVLEICNKLKGEHPCRSEISIKLQKQRFLSKSNFIEIALQYGCFPINLLHLFQNTLS